MKKNKIYLSSLFLIAIFLISSSGYSTSFIRNITSVIDERINITWNGNKFTPTEINGDEIKPLLYNGRSYLPLRSIAEMLDINVEWDNINKTIILEDNTNNLIFEAILRENYELQDELYYLRQENVRLENALNFSRTNNQNSVNYYLPDFEKKDDKKQIQREIDQLKIDMKNWTNECIQRGIVRSSIYTSRMTEMQNRLKELELKLSN